MRTWGTKGVVGSDDKTFGRPADIAWDSQNNFYVADGYGNTRVVKVRDPKNLQNLKIGDQVVATYTEALAVAVKPVK